MEQETIITLLTNSGLKVFDIDANFVYFEDPSCIFPAFDTVFHYAWLAVIILTGIMLFGWAVLYIKNGVKIDTLFNNAKTLILILCVLSLAIPIVNFIYGDNLFAKQCDRMQVSLVEVNELLEQRNKNFAESDEAILNEDYSYNDTDESYIPATSNSAYVEYTNNSTIYITPNGERIKRTGGSPAWRNNNPGNIRKSKFALQHGAIGSTDKWAVFPDEETGLNAIVDLLQTKTYMNLTIKEAINKWAPVSDGNNPNSYAEHIAQKTGLTPESRINSLTNSDLKKISRAIQQIEGWKPGLEQRI